MQAHTPRAGTQEELAEFLVGRHPGVVQVMRHMTYAHLPAPLQAISAPVCALAAQMVDRLPDGPELTVGLRKLLEAKDALVRAAIEAGGTVGDLGRIDPAECACVSDECEGAPTGPVLYTLDELMPGALVGQTQAEALQDNTAAWGAPGRG